MADSNARSLYLLLIPFPLVLLLTLLGCSRQPSLNIVLISVDTLRSDSLGCYGNPRARTPAIDRLAAEGTLFERTLTPIPSTLPSHTTMLTGLFPWNHRVRANGWKLDSRFPTLPKLLKKDGYSTGAFLGAFVLDRRFNLSEGFDRYDDDCSKGIRESRDVFQNIPLGRMWGKKEESYERRAEEVTQRALEWLGKEAEEPFFLFVHYFDPHYPYIPPPQWAPSGFPQEGQKGMGLLELNEKWLKGSPSELSDILKKTIEDLYLCETSYTDHWAGKLLEKLHQMGVWERTLICFTGDHGEGLNNHDYKLHGDGLYEEQLRVPLIFEGPNIPKGKRIQAQVSLADLAPTLLDASGGSGGTFNGKSLMPFFRGEGAWEDQGAFSESGTSPLLQRMPKFFSLTTPEAKLITDRFSGFQKFYLLDSDPGESKDLIRQVSEIAFDFWEDLRNRQEEKGRLSRSARPMFHEKLGKIIVMEPPVKVDFFLELPPNPVLAFAFGLLDGMRAPSKEGEIEMSVHMEGEPIFSQVLSLEDFLNKREVLSKRIRIEGTRGRGVKFSFLIRSSGSRARCFLMEPVLLCSPVEGRERTLFLQLKERLEAFLKDPLVKDFGQQEMDEETVQKLRKMGYLR